VAIGSSLNSSRLLKPLFLAFLLPAYLGFGLLDSAIEINIVSKYGSGSGSGLMSNDASSFMKYYFPLIPIFQLPKQYVLLWSGCLISDINITSKYIQKPVMIIE
jgi:hypothetical protein